MDIQQIRRLDIVDGRFERLKEILDYATEDQFLVKQFMLMMNPSLANPEVLMLSAIADNGRSREFCHFWVRLSDEEHVDWQEDTDKHENQLYLMHNFSHWAKVCAGTVDMNFSYLHNRRFMMSGCYEVCYKSLLHGRGDKTPEYFMRFFSAIIEYYTSFLIDTPDGEGELGSLSDIDLEQVNTIRNIPFHEWSWTQFLFIRHHVSRLRIIPTYANGIAPPVTTAELKARVFAGLDVSKDDISELTSLANVFRGATGNTSDISGWDVSGIISFRDMFRGSDFNGNIADWDVSGATSTNNMFFRNASFNQPLANWDMSNVVSMVNMFGKATAFAQDLSNWTPDAATQMTQMFNGATSMTDTVSGWDVTGVTHHNNFANNANGISEPVWD